MRPRKPPRKGGSAAPQKQRAQSLEERAEELLQRLETGGQNPVQAAEELDRLQAALERSGALDHVRERIEALADAEWTNDDTIRRLQGMYEFRQRRFTSLRDGDAGYEGRSAAYRRLTKEIIGAQRDALLELRNSGRITDEVMRRVERDLDLEESRLETPA